MEIKKIKIKSLMIGKGLSFEANDPVEQDLVISADGTVRFSERSYRQHCKEKGFLRKEKVSIGSWNTNFLLPLIDKIPEVPVESDEPAYTITVTYKDGSIKEWSGPINEESVKKDGIDLSELFARYIPIQSLRTFRRNTDGDIKNLKGIREFSEGWLVMFEAEEFPLQAFVQSFGEECKVLGFREDRNHEVSYFDRLAFEPNENKQRRLISMIRSIDFLGSAAYTLWWNLTYEMRIAEPGKLESMKQNKTLYSIQRWFVLVLRRIIENCIAKEKEEMNQKEGSLQ